MDQDKLTPDEGSAEEKAANDDVSGDAAPTLEQILNRWNRRDALVHEGLRPEGHRPGHGTRRNELKDG
ncbi:MAG: hypothetical protein OEL20_04855 [Sulfuritalea sp.]|nr:hypothetical protein [Sulfuritalea sp.]